MNIRTIATPYQFLRSGPATTYAWLRRVYPTDSITLLNDSDAPKLGLSYWLKVRVSGIEGWMSALYLRPAASPVYPYASVGLHGPADPGAWAWTPAVFDVFRRAKIQSAKLLAAADMGGWIVDQLRGVGVKYFLMRAFNMINPSYAIWGTDYILEIADALRRLYAAGIRDVEVGNEPNLGGPIPEGMWVSWQDGYGYGQWWLAAAQAARKLMPEARLGFPAMSPGSAIPGFRFDGNLLFKQAESAWKTADFLCYHVYWDDVHSNLYTALDSIKQFALEHPTRRIVVSEFGNPNRYVPKEVKGREYAEFYTRAKTVLPKNVTELYAYCVSASYTFEDETWINSAIPDSVGARAIL